ncbi:MAG: OmpA family protein [Thermodesulfobacteriota bacterium]|nr:OmpA family protein [Thermodesulfobacteriota bacterium]
MKKKRKGEEEPKDTFIVLMTALSVLLLAFFILLNSMSVLDNQKTKAALGSIKDSFGILSGGRSIEKKGRNTPWFARPSDIVIPSINDLFTDLHQEIKKRDIQEQITVKVTEKGVNIILGSKVMFDSGDASLREDIIPVFKKISSILKKYQYPVSIEGHTDNMPISNSRFPSNWELSTARAVSVLEYIVEAERISPYRLSAVGYGEYHPLCSNDTEEGRSKNRRVVITMHGDIYKTEKSNEIHK